MEYRRNWDDLSYILIIAFNSFCFSLVSVSWLPLHIHRDFVLHVYILYSMVMIGGMIATLWARLESKPTLAGNEKHVVSNVRIIGVSIFLVATMFMDILTIIESLFCIPSFFRLGCPETWPKLAILIMLMVKIIYLGTQTVNFLWLTPKLGAGHGGLSTRGHLVNVAVNIALLIHNLLFECRIIFRGDHSELVPLCLGGESQGSYDVITAKSCFNETSYISKLRKHADEYLRPMMTEYFFLASSILINQLIAMNKNRKREHNIVPNGGRCCGNSVHENSGSIRENSGSIHENSGSIHENSGSIHGNSWSIRGSSGSIRGNSESIRGYSGSIRGNSGSIRGNSGSIRGSSGSIRGNSESIRGNSGSIRGNSGSIRGNSGSIRGNSGSIHGNSGRIQCHRAGDHGRIACTHSDTRSGRPSPEINGDTFTVFRNPPRLRPGGRARASTANQQNDVTIECSSNNPSIQNPGGHCSFFIMLTVGIATVLLGLAQLSHIWAVTVLHDAFNTFVMNVGAVLVFVHIRRALKINSRLLKSLKHLHFNYEMWLFSISSCGVFVTNFAKMLPYFAAMFSQEIRDGVIELITQTMPHIDEKLFDAHSVLIILEFSSEILLTVVVVIYILLLENDMETCYFQRFSPPSFRGQLYILIFGSLAFWAYKSFVMMETSKMNASAVFYDTGEWAVMMHVLNPVSVYYHFHAFLIFTEYLTSCFRTGREDRVAI